MKKTIITAILATIILTGLGGNLRAQAVASLADDTIARCDSVVRIPMKHGVDSLNVAACAAIAFWEITR